MFRTRLLLQQQGITAAKATVKQQFFISAPILEKTRKYDFDASFEHVRAQVQKKQPVEFQMVDSLFTHCEQRSDLKNLHFLYTVMKEYRMQTKYRHLRSLLTAFAHASDMNAAEKILSDMIVSKVVTVNAFYTMMTNYLRMNQFDKVIQMYDKMNTAGLVPTSMMYSVVISACLRQQKYALAEQVLKEMKEPADAYQYNQFMTHFRKLGQMDKALYYFDLMKKNNVKLNMSVYNSLIDGFAKLGKWEQVNELRSEAAKQIGFQYDISTLNSMLAGYCEAKQFDAAEKLLSEYQSVYKIAPIGATFCILLGAYEKADLTTKMIDLLVKIEKEHANALHPSHFAYIFRALSKKQEFDTALSIYEMHLQKSNHLNSQNTLPLISALCAAKQLDKAEEVVESLGSRANVHSYTALLHGYAYAGGLQKIFDIFERMEQKNIAPNVYSCTIAMEVMIANNELDKANKLLKSLNVNKDGMAPSAFTFNALLKALIKSRKYKEAIEFINNMPVKDDATYSMLVKSLVHTNQLGKAMDIFAEMNKTATPKSQTMAISSIIASLCRIGKPEEAEKWLEKIKKMNMPLDRFSLTPVIIGYTTAKKMNDALRLFNTYRTSSIADRLLYDSLINGCRSNDNLMAAIRLLDDMKDANITPNKTTIVQLANAFKKANDEDQFSSLMKYANTL